MKKIFAAALFAATLSQAFAIAPVKRIVDANGKVITPKVNIPTVMDASRVAEQEQLVSKTYGPSGSSDGLGTYGQTCPTKIGAVKTIGAVTLPVLLVEFSDVKFQDFTSEQKLSRQLNEEGYSDVDYVNGRTSYAATGSVRDFFLAQSSGLFQPTFDVVGRVTLPQTVAYYFQDNEKTERRDINMYSFLSDAMNAANTKGIDFSKYVISGNANIAGTTTGIPMISFICAGYNEASVGYGLYEYNGDKTGLDMPWPHFSRLSNESGTGYGRKYNGTTVMSYFIGSELYTTTTLKRDADGKTIATLGDPYLAGPGTFTHEFGHALGLPDFYTTDYTEGCKTPTYWSMMDHGNYFNEGYNLIGYAAYERILLGWLKYTTLGKESQQCTLYPFSAIGKEGTPDDAVFAYIIKNPLSVKEYYVLEDRRADGVFYPSKMGNGMLVARVYFDYNQWENNTLNNKPETQRYSIIPADGKWQEEISGNNYKNDLFPGVSNNYTSLTDDSTPQNAVCLAGTKKVMTRPIYNIRKDGELIRFDYLEDFLTGISTVNAEGIDHKAYDLQGRQATVNAAHGIFIVNGKKIIR